MLLPLIDPTLTTAANAGTIRLAGRAVALAAFAIALTRPEIDARARLGPVLGAAVLAIAIVAVVFSVIRLNPGLLQDEPDLTFKHTTHFVIAGLLVTVWLSLAAAYLWSGIRHRRILFAWLGLGFFLLGVAQIVGLPSTLTPELTLVGPPVLRIFGYACALIGVLAEYGFLYASQGRVIHRAALEAEQTAEQIRRERERIRVTGHEARNALHLVDVGTSILEQQQQLTPEEREEIRRGVERGITRLRDILLTAEPSADADASAPPAHASRDPRQET